MSNVDWNHWLNMPSVKLWEAVALSMDADPENEPFIGQYFRAGRLGESELNEDGDKFRKRLVLLKAHFSDTKHLRIVLVSSDNDNSRVYLNSFVEWALNIVHWDIPKELKSLESTKKEVGVEPNENPWDIHQEGDPQPIVLWYTPARYFARKLIKENPRLLKRRDSLCFEISKELDAHRIYKRGGKEAPDPETIKKALSNIKLD